LSNCAIQDAGGKLAHSITQPFGWRSRHTPPAAAGDGGSVGTEEEAIRTAKKPPDFGDFFPAAVGKPDVTFFRNVDFTL